MINFLNKKFIFTLIIFVGLILRFYNINFDDYWYDEIIGFWVASPEHSFSKSFEIHNRIEINTYTYHFFLKSLYNLFGYEISTGRYFSLFFSSLTLLIVPFFFKEKLSNESLLLIFLISLNIYLISYAQESRVYSILFFTILCFFLFLKKVFEKKANNLDYLFLIFFLFISISLHSFAIIILTTIIFFLILKFFFHKEIFSKLNYSLLIVSVFSIFFYYFYLSSLDLSTSNHYWISNPDLKFFTNFFFSNFFGSRLMGLIYLFSLMFLILQNLRYLRNLNFFTFFLLLIIFSYLIPLTFGYLFKPVLISRYIIFVIFPILTLISVFVFKYPNLKIRKIIISILVIATFSNHFTEQTFKQFYNDRVPSKPEYKKAVKFINTSDFKNLSIKVENMKSDDDSINAIKNYIKYISSYDNENLKFYDLKKEKYNQDYLWLFCAQDINKRECLPPENFKVITEKNFNNINLKLLQKN